MNTAQLEVGVMEVLAEHPYCTTDQLADRLQVSSTLLAVVLRELEGLTVNRTRQGWVLLEEPEDEVEVEEPLKDTSSWLQTTSYLKTHSNFICGVIGHHLQQADPTVRCVWENHSGQILVEREMSTTDLQVGDQVNFTPYVKGKSFLSFSVNSLEFKKGQIIFGLGYTTQYKNPHRRKLSHPSPLLISRPLPLANYSFLFREQVEKIKALLPCLPKSKDRRRNLDVQRQLLDYGLDPRVVELAYSLWGASTEKYRNFIYLTEREMPRFENIRYRIDWLSERTGFRKKTLRDWRFVANFHPYLEGLFDD